MPRGVYKRAKPTTDRGREKVLEALVNDYYDKLQPLMTELRNLARQHGREFIITTTSDGSFDLSVEQRRIIH